MHIVHLFIYVFMGHGLVVCGYFCLKVWIELDVSIFFSYSFAVNFVSVTYNC